MLFALPGAAAAAQSIELVSQAAFSANTNGDLASVGPLDLSDDSRFVLFASDASNLVLNDNNDRADLFLLDTQTGEVERIATDVSSAAVPYYYGDASLSNDARYVLYNHRPDASNVYQVYRFDRLTRTTLLISADADGMAGNNSSMAGGLSADGRYAVFTSYASLLPNVQTRSVYRYDALTAQLQIVPAASDSGVAADITPDGRYVLYESGIGRLVMRDMDSATSTTVNVTADGVVLSLQNLPDPYKSSCSNRRISDDGRYVVFVTDSDADPSDTDSAYDVYRYDRLSNTRELISTTVAGVSPDRVNVCPGISADGQRIAFFSTVHMDTYKLMLRDMAAGTLRVMVGYIIDRDVGGLSLGDEPEELFFHTSGLPIYRGRQVFRYRDDGAPVVLSRAYAAGSAFADGHSGDSAVNPAGYDLGPGVSADGRFVVFSSNAENLVGGFSYACDIFVRDRTAGTTARVYWAGGGLSLSQCANPSITPDSRYVVFSANRYLGPVPYRLQRDIFRYDRTTDWNLLISVDASGAVADASSSGPHMSDDGDLIAFQSQADDLVAGMTSAGQQIYLRSISTGTTMLVSRTPAGQPGNGAASRPFVSADGRYVAFSSAASNLVSNDDNGRIDAFVFDRISQQVQRLSAGSSPSGGGGGEAYGLSTDGNLALFTSNADDLVAGTSGSHERVYLRNRAAGTTRLIAAPGDSEGKGKSPALSPDGRYVAFISPAPSMLTPFDNNDAERIYLFDAYLGNTRALTYFSTPAAAFNTWQPRFSSDGQNIVFSSTRGDLAPDGMAGISDIFLARSSRNDVIFSDNFE